MMKYTNSLLACLTVLLVAITAPAAFAGGVETGNSAPNFTLPDSNGNTHSLADFSGKYIVLEWTNHQCPFVVKHYGSGNMQKLQSEWTGKDVVWLSIISSAPGKQGHVDAMMANQLSESRKTHATAVLLDADGTAGRLYNAQTTPHMYIINPEGILIYQGAIDSIRSANPKDISKAKNYVSAALTEAMSGKAVTDATTRPYGCSVKY